MAYPVAAPRDPKNINKVKQRAVRPPRKCDTLVRRQQSTEETKAIKKEDTRVEFNEQNRSASDDKKNEEITGCRLKIALPATLEGEHEQSPGTPERREKKRNLTSTPSPSLPLKLSTPPILEIQSWNTRNSKLY